MKFILHVILIDDEVKWQMLHPVLHREVGEGTWFREKKVCDIGCSKKRFTMCYWKHFGISFLCSVDSSRAQLLIDAAKSCLNHDSSYEKAVFDVVLYLISPNREDDLAVELHSKVPVLETPDGEIFERNTIARYVARLNSGWILLILRLT